MKFLCETIRGLIGVSSSILQDIIVLEAAVISGPYSNGGDDTATYATTSTTAGKNPPQVSQRMIELIGDISNLSMKMNIFSKDHEKKARETAKYIKMMKDVIMKQQEEVERLDNQIPIKKSVGTDMEDLVKAEEKLRVSYAVEKYVVPSINSSNFVTGGRFETAKVTPESNANDAIQA
jgi:hypothetical protein